MRQDRNADARQITNQDDFRRYFWRNHPHVVRKKYRNGDYPADTRMAFVDFVDACARDGIISERLAARVTLASPKGLDATGKRIIDAIEKEISK